MHELGVVFSMIDVLEETAEEQNLSHIYKVSVDFGEVSGIVTDFFEDAWKWASEQNDLIRGAELEVNVVEAVTVCNACGRTYGTVEHGRICPHCDSPDTELLHGRELLIRSIEAD